MKRRAPIVWLLRKIRRRIPALLLMTAAHVGSALLGVLFALGTRNVINSAADRDSEQLWSAVFLLAAIILGILICVTLYRHLHDRLSADLDRDWKRSLLHSLLRADYKSVSAYHSGELINRLNNDVRIVDEGVLSTLPGLASMLTRLISAICVLAVMELRFALILVGAGIAVVLLTGLVRQHLKKLHKQVSECEGAVSGFLQEILEKILMVQAMDVAQEAERRSDILLEKRFLLQRKRKNVSLLANSCVSILSYAASFGALVWCAVGLAHGQMSFGDLTAVTQLVGQLQGPFVNLSGFLPRYVAMIAACERLMELDELTAGQENDPPAEDPGVLYADMTAIEARALCFAYDRDQVLSDVSFFLPKGAITVVTGPSGIGKSTLLKLMLGVFRPEQGELFLKRTREETPLSRGTRRLFAYVPQGNLLLSGTLRENVILTRPGASEEEIDQAVFVSAMDAFLPQLPNGLETVLGENAAGLSEGQAQRLAIARAVLGGAPVLLLDEATSALDAETERIVLERLRSLPGRTCIAVTHRPAALELADFQLEVTESGVRCIQLKPQ